MVDCLLPFVVLTKYYVPKNFSEINQFLPSFLSDFIENLQVSTSLYAWRREKDVQKMKKNIVMLFDFDKLNYLFVHFFWHFLV
jgi:hypothetical protein